MVTKGTVKNQEERQGWLSILPAIFLVLAIKGYPLVLAIIKSFTNWNGLTRSEFVGFKNYITLLSGDEFWLLLRNTSILLVYVPIQVLLGIIVALLIYEETAGWRFFRTVFYLPQMVSMVVIGYLFAIFFGYSGPINFILSSVGLEHMALEWLGDAKTALPIIIFCLVWMNIGWQALIFTGGMASINTSVFDAVKIDGAGYWRKLWSVTLPMLIRTVEYSLIVSVIWIFTAMFPIIFTMTNGGPGYETTTIDYMIYIKAFISGNQLGLACALAVILTVIVLVITKIQMAISDKSDDWG